MEEEERFPRLTETLLGQRGLTVNSYSGGVAAGNTLHNIATLLGKGVPLRPTHVIMMENINDFVQLVSVGSYWTDDPFRSIVIDFSKREQPWPRLLAAARELFVPGIVGALTVPTSLRPGTRVAQLTEDQIAEAYAANLNAFVGLTRSYGADPVLATQASRFVEPMPDVIRNDFVMAISSPSKD
jgi:hypothetical protein